MLKSGLSGRVLGVDSLKGFTELVLAGGINLVKITDITFDENQSLRVFVCCCTRVHVVHRSSIIKSNFIMACMDMEPNTTPMRHPEITNAQFILMAPLRLSTKYSTNTVLVLVLVH
ncbi:hypothetical protein Hz2V086 [Helicoverpa zea nudivirus 2]|uniref:Uncharacterized protein n=1 Tax=Helicoverpa zea nudivirus 2 TaxID=1128424 RepID=G9I0B2_HZNV2|nr:orf86 gene product [Helicoverpa zea nudivirus 2]AEW69635.1 hypothetical protein Hz2V086 [Helicoverpa zea nudivirus 2]